MTTEKNRATRVALTIVSLFAVLLAASASFTDDSVSLKTNFFNDSGGLHVQSPTIDFVKEIARSTVLSLHYSLDRVSIPPYRGISAKPLPTDGITGASRPVDSTSANIPFIKKRNELIAAINSTQWNATAYYSIENDYTGRLIRFGVNQDFNQKNTNLSLGVGYGWDAISPIGTTKLYTKRNLLVEAALTQTLSPVMILRLGVDVSKLNGFQSNPYRLVFVGGGYSLEQHPGQRLRVSGYAKLNTYFRPTNASLWSEYRLYNDDWGILSHTIGLKFYQNISKRLHVRYRYRYYQQSAANFYRANYSLVGKPRYFTADYKLEPFNSHLFGFHLTYGLDGLRQHLSWLEHSIFEMKYERFFTSNNFTANIFQLGLTFEY